MQLSGPQRSLAIVGMECRLPGADGLEAFWELIRTGKSALGPLPEDRLNRKLYYDQRKGVVGKSYSELGGIVSSRPIDFTQLPLPKELVEQSDIAHLILCEVAAKACRDAGYDPFQLPNRNVGVYIGHTGGSPWVSDLVYSTIVAEGAQHLLDTPLFRDLPQASQVVDEIVARIRQQHPGRKPGVKLDLGALSASRLISQAFNLAGPYMAVDAACASSMQAMAVGIRALQQGRIEMAIVGGASYCKSDSLVLFSAAQSVSQTGSCPFGANADGLVSAEGYVILVLKTLERAIADGDRIRAVIRGVGVSSDGKGKSLWAPRKEGQQLAVHRAYGDGLDVQRLQYIEAHATSTQVGDATELQALSEALTGKLPKGQKIPVGAVKGNVGHTLETAGMAGMVKTILAMQHGVIPPVVGNGELTAEIDWSKTPFYVPFREERWPEFEDGHSRRAAVNAFGIGGLNVHVVLDQQPTSAERKATVSRPTSPAIACVKSSPNDDRAIAIVGGGCIFPGALTVAAFWDLLSTGRDPKTAAPKSRWNADLYTQPGEAQTWHTYSSAGGYITDFVYDWKKHKVPPKQIANANPLQFMLLDAADQALRDAGYDSKPFDSTRTAVVVGTIFGGDFSNHLQMGLRLPEFEITLRDVLTSRGIASERIAGIAEQFAKLLLERMPALLDETGSFTSSTLASRITKTFNLMGGALAIDAGECSATFALQAAVDMLLEGSSDMVVCAAGQRSMDAWVFETMAIDRALSPDQPRGAFDAHSNGYLPGEGCGAVVLKRLADAKRDGDPIRAVIRGIGAARSHSSAMAIEKAMVAALADAGLPSIAINAIESHGSGIANIDLEELTALERVHGDASRTQPLAIGSLRSQIGYTGGGAGMAALLKTSLGLQHGTLPATVNFQNPSAELKQHARFQSSGKSIALLGIGSAGYRAAGITTLQDDMAYHVIVDNGVPVPPFAAPTAKVNVPSAVSIAKNPWRVFRFAGADRGSVTKLLTHAVAGLPATFSKHAAEFSAEDRVRLAIVADSTETLAKRLRLAQEALNSSRGGSWEEQGIYLCDEVLPRRQVAALFPGQGSQYAGMFQDWGDSHEAAQRAISDVSAAMLRQGWESFDQLAWNSGEALGNDIWYTQASMLLADTIAYRTATACGLKPDFIGAHSFGEFPALIAAGAWSLDDAVVATRSRCDAILSSSTGRGLMLSVLSTKTQVQQLLGERPDQVWMCAENGPEQHVVGGTPAAVDRFANRCGQLRIKTKVLKVPCPFHTPLMRDTQAPLAAALDKLCLVPPRVPLMSSISGRFLSDPLDLRASLVQQMTEPVQFTLVMQRLYDVGVRVFVEVGPSQVLTQLGRRTLAAHSDAFLFALDHPNRSGAEQFVRLQAFLGVLGAYQTQATPIVSSAAIPEAQTVPTTIPAQGQRIKLVDATERRRARMRAEASARRSPSTVVDSHAPQANGHENNGHGGNGNGKNGNSSGHGLSNGKSSTGHQPEVSKPMTPSAPLSAAEQERFQIIARVISDCTQNKHLALTPDSPWQKLVANPAVIVEELAEYFDIAPAEANALLERQTAGELAVALRNRPGKVEWAPTASNAKFLDLQAFLVQFVVDQTGYPAEIVELDADLEADLGIDSIKKAQLFGEIGEQFDLQPDENLSLDDFPTLRHVHQYLVAQPGLASQATDNSPPSVLQRTSTSTAPVTNLAAETSIAVLELPRKDTLDLEAFLVNFVVEQTGYPAEIVELDADLEADLGIDSIKKAQLFGELGEQFDLQPDENLSLDDFPTLRHVLKYLLAQPGLQASNHSSSLASSPAPIAMAAQTVAANVPVPSSPEESADLQAFLVNFVVEQTGYPAEIVELDADLEADLGIDSIKKAQLFGEIGEQFAVQADESLSLDDFPTLRHVLQYLQQVKASDGAEADHSANLPEADTTSPDIDNALALGIERGRKHIDAIRYLLRRRSAAFRVDGASQSQVAAFVEQLTPIEFAELRGMAQGAAVLEESLLAMNAALACGELVSTGEVIASSRGLAVSAQHGVPLVLEARAVAGRIPCVVVSLPGQRGALAGFNAHGIVASYTPDRHQAGVVDAGAVWVLRVLESCRDLASATALVTQARLPNHASLELGSIGQPNATSALDCPIEGTREQILANADALKRTQARHRDTHWLTLLLSDQDMLVQAGQGDYLLKPSAPQTQALPFTLRVPGYSAASVREKAIPPLEVAPASPITQRYVMRMAAHPLETSTSRPLRGPFAIIGANADAEALRGELVKRGESVVVLPSAELQTSLADWDRILDRELPFTLLLLSPRDASVSAHAGQTQWNTRRQRGVVSPFFMVQHWIARLAQRQMLDQASLLAVTALGGDFGLSGEVVAAEGGAISGLLKGLRLEFPSLSVRIVDAQSNLASPRLAQRVVQELTTVDDAIEVGFAASGERYTILPAQQSIDALPLTTTPQRGSAWIITGGARGVTAVIARELGERFGLKLHLVGATKPAVIEPSWLDFSAEQLKSLRGTTMLSARQRGVDPVSTWKAIEKSLEIGRNLQMMRAAGLDVTYHVCDVADRVALASTLDEVRRTAGPIHGIIHGAGFEAAARFDRKKLEMVDRTIAAKNDGAAALIGLTTNDPLQFFVGFGSTSGRLGGVGQTDYCLANDMLAKQLAQLSSERPSCRSTVFHWHAWDEVGMAARPESRFALEAFGLKFMPLHEGVRHLIGEIMAGLPESEVLVTEPKLCPVTVSADAIAALPIEQKVAEADSTPVDWDAFLVNFVVEQTGYPPEIVDLDADLEADLGIDSIKKAQLFGEIGEQFGLQADEDLSLDDFPTLRHVREYLVNTFKQDRATKVTPTTAVYAVAATAITTLPRAELGPLLDSVSSNGSGQFIATATLDPVRDIFLTQHRLAGKPVFPGVIGLELLAQAAIAAEQGGILRRIRNADIPQGMRFFNNEPRVARVKLDRYEEAWKAQLLCDFRDRNGRVIDSDRVHVTGDVELVGPSRVAAPSYTASPFPLNAMKYPDRETMYHGPAFRTLKGLMFQRDGGWGQLVAPELSEMAGARRATGWLLPTALLDGCFVACGVFSFLMCGQRVEIPRGLELLELYRAAIPGEKCSLRFTICDADPANNRFDFTLFGADQLPILYCQRYRTVTLSSEEPA